MELSVQQSYKAVSFVQQEGFSPLDPATNYQHQEVVTKLLDHGTDKEKKDEVRKVLFNKLCTVSCCLVEILLLWIKIAIFSLKQYVGKSSNASQWEWLVSHIFPLEEFAIGSEMNNRLQFPGSECMKQHGSKQGTKQCWCMDTIPQGNSLFSSSISPAIIPQSHTKHISHYETCVPCLIKLAKTPCLGQ